jgi:hypothetical protein
MATSEPWNSCDMQAERKGFEEIRKVQSAYKKKESPAYDR